MVCFSIFIFTLERLRKCIYDKTKSEIEFLSQLMQILATQTCILAIVHSVHSTKYNELSLHYIKFENFIISEAYVLFIEAVEDISILTSQETAYT